MTDTLHTTPPSLVDGFGRTVSYLRVSLTDRCNFRCFYCMAEAVEFLPRREVLSLEETDRLCSAFVAQGVRTLRLTGGEPLVRPGVMDLVRALSRHIATGALDELTLTTNGAMLFKHAAGLAAAGVRRINVSLDTLDPHKFAAITRWGKLPKVLEGIAAAAAAGLAIKINTVALKGVNDDEIHTLVAWCGDRGHDLTFIEVMPMDGVRHDAHFLPLTRLRRDLEARWTLTDSAHRTGGPARYATVAETGGRIGFITPLTHGFCEGCNRVRLTCNGQLCPCLGQRGAVDLRAVLRSGADDATLAAAVRGAIGAKPRGHDFADADAPRRRAMHRTGG